MTDDEAEDGVPIHTPAHDNAVAIYAYTCEGGWVRALQWWRGQVTVTGAFTDVASRDIARLAARLGVRLAGDDGEIYDSVTGQAIRH